MARAARNRLLPSGLRWRLAAAVAGVTLICTGIAFAAVYRGTATELRRQIDHELSGDSSELVAALTAAHARDAAGLSRAASSYVRSQPFRLSSTLLYVLIPGATTITNRPELFRLEPDDGETLAEQHREDALSARLLAAHQGYSTLTGADIGQLRLLRVPVSIRGFPHPLAVGVGETLATVAEAQSSVARAFILAGLLALAGALLASYLIGTRVSRPLRRMAAVAARVDAGDLHPRIPEPDRLGGEVKVLADSFNHMLDRLTEAFAGQRAFVADASHELRTPLTVIRGQLEVLAAQPNPTSAEVRRVERLAAAEIARISRLVDDLLLLAKSEQTEFLKVDAIDLQRYVGELWDGMTLVADRRFELSDIAEGTLRADPDRLAQALRNLIANAIEHTAPDRGLVRLRVQTAGERVTFVVQDDGPGVAPEQREAVFRRFHRTDSARDRGSGGTGLGLAIVRAIAEAHGGSVRADVSPEGGASFELTLPGFRPDRPRREPAAVATARERDAAAGRPGAVAG
ncbi:MAG TPA: HAMP domain-containing sensor histidine kinase [Solirubrobacteraceae bacterium]|jgi:signal transduction histidine kinase|nr:HAMP domain-containing sensor histidine kinase [Solirubrobacteraceae bacterium]